MSKIHKICLITGSYPPLRCGVGDYTSQLASVLVKCGLEVHVVTSLGAAQGGGGETVHAIAPGWTVAAMPGLLSKIRDLKPDIVHLQYPTNGYGYKLGPQAIVLLARLVGQRVVTTSHEFIRARFLRKVSLIPFFLFSHWLMFTSEEERMAIGASLPWLRSKLQRASSIIPVGTNIPVETALKHGEGRTVSFFGLFYPGKMIETVIEAFRVISTCQPDSRFRLIGDVHPLHRDYFLKIRELAAQQLPSSRLEWFTGRSPEEIARALAGSAVCLLPYPDGATFRRTTLMAALSLGVPVVTTRSDNTPPLLSDGQNVLFASDGNEMAAQAMRILTDPGLAARISTEAKQTSSAFSWDRIVRDHLTVYQKMMGPA